MKYNACISPDHLDAECHTGDPSPNPTPRSTRKLLETEVIQLVHRGWECGPLKFLFRSTEALLPKDGEGQSNSIILVNDDSLGR